MQTLPGYLSDLRVVPLQQLLEEITLSLTAEWPPFSSAEIHKALNKCNNSSVPGPDHLSWRYLKRILYNEGCMTNIVNITNACINLSYWPMHFKKSSSIIISKPNKSLYDSSKSFRPIVLLNTIGKLIEKVINNKIQVHTICKGDWGTKLQKNSQLILQFVIMIQLTSC